VQVAGVVDERAEHRVQRCDGPPLADPVAHVPVQEVADPDALADGPARHGVRDPVLQREDALVLAGPDVDPDVEARRTPLIETGAQRVLGEEGA
jgi:hypothetical protein